MKKQLSLLFALLLLVTAIFTGTGTATAADTDVVKYSPYDVSEIGGKLVFSGFLYNVGNAAVESISSLKLETYDDKGTVFDSKTFTEEFKGITLQPGETKEMKLSFDTYHKAYNFSVRTTAVYTQSTTKAYSGGVHVFVLNKPLNTDVQPTIVNGRTLVPMRAILEQLGLNVSFNEATSTVTASNSSYTLQHKIGTNVLTANGKAKTLDVGSQIIDGRTMVPLRAISQGVGCASLWGSQDGAMTITIVKYPNM